MLKENTSENREGIFKTLVDDFVKGNEFELICPKDLGKTIEDMDADLDIFESNIDFILSESNTKTMLLDAT